MFPTYYSGECFPLVLLEAMQHELPCISTNNGGIPDIIENEKTGLITQQKDCRSLADCIQDLLDNRQLRIEYGHNGYIQYKNKLTQKKFEQRLVSVLSRILKS